MANENKNELLMDAAKRCAKTIQTPEFLKWLEKRWIDAYYEIATVEVIEELGFTVIEAVDKFNTEKE